MPVRKLDWSTSFSEEEYEQLLVHYKFLGGQGVVDRFRFVPFMFNLRPDALKRYRLVVNSGTEGIGLKDPLPNPPYIAFIIGQFYCTLPYPQGVMADIETARAHGAKKSEVADLLALGWLHSGPFGMNVVATYCEEYMAAWVKGTELRGSGGQPVGLWIVQSLRAESILKTAPTTTPSVRPT